MPSIATLTINPAVDISTSVGKIVPVHKLRCASSRYDPGGGGINAARVIRRMGGDVTAIYPVGGATGQLLNRLVDSEGVASVTFPVRNETRTSFTVLEQDTGNEYRFVLPGPPLVDAEWQQAIDELERMDPRPELLVMSGSVPPGVPDDFYARVARTAKAWGAKLVLDASGPALAAGLADGVFLIKPSLRELRELTGDALDSEPSQLAACRGLIASGRAEIVALTLGDQGALLVTRHRALRAPALKVEAVSTVGAGDSFLGAVVWALTSAVGLEEAFRYGLAAGSAALLTPGTELCRIEHIKALHDQVTLHAV
jgi:6-phosphofructokinase 2